MLYYAQDRRCNMKKEILTKENIKHDLLISIKANYSNKADWRFSISLPLAILAILSGILLKNIWIGLLIFSFAAYQMVRYIIAEKKFNAQIKAAKDAVMREDFIVSIETLDKVREETIYEPHVHGYGSHVHTRHAHTTNDVYFFYFRSEIKWRMPEIRRHYAWSKDYYISSEGLNNTSVSGNEFYFIRLESDPKIAYIYNTKFFEFDEY